MAEKKHKDFEVLEGVNLEADCRAISTEALTPSPDHAEPSATIDDQTRQDSDQDATDESDELPSHVTWLNVPTLKQANDSAIRSWKPLRGRWSILLERVALTFESLVNRLTGVQFNPLYHTGTIGFLLLGIVGLTGMYLFFFFQYGYDASYSAVARMESQFIARIIRASHRYASGALVLVTLLHAYRTLFLEKFRGPRWLAWLTGVFLTTIVWMAGVTGYWLIWDQRALLITDTFRQGLESLTGWAPSFMVYVLNSGNEGRSWILFLVLIAAHIILFLVALGFFYLHIHRLKRPKWLPPVHWVIVISLVVFVAAVFFPVGMLPQADLAAIPDAISFDPIFLFFLAAPESGWLWLTLLALLIGFAGLPWFSRVRRRASAAPTEEGGPLKIEPALLQNNAILLPPPVRIIKERCTGCTKCALDCPYGAIEMVERHDGRPHKYIAIEKPDLCVSCGICIGSCDALAVTLGDALPETLWGLVSSQLEHRGREPQQAAGEGDSVGLMTPEVISPRLRGVQVIYTCERHAIHGASGYLSAIADSEDADQVVVIPLPCVGAVPPDLLSRTLDAGARGVKIIGCPPDDCAGREGNLWAEQRLLRQRMPRLRRPYVDTLITAAWLPPNEFAAAVPETTPLTDAGQVDYPASRRMLKDLNWRNLMPAAGLLFVALVLQIILTDFPLRLNTAGLGAIELVSADIGSAFGNLTSDRAFDDTYLMQLLVDGEHVMSRVFTAEELLGVEMENRHAFFHSMSLPPGEYDISLNMTGSPSGARHVMLDELITIEPGGIWRPELEDFSTPACSVSIGGAANACPQ